MSRPTDYEKVAPTYDRRYRSRHYDDVGNYLLDWAQPEPALRVLEIGCGTGHWLSIFRDAGCAVTGVDPSPAMLSRAKEGAHEVLLGTAEAVPLPNQSFDRIVCVNAFHHFPDKVAALREAKRLLRTGGKFVTIALDPHEGSDRWFLYEYFEGTLEIDKERYPSCEWIRREMAAAGFERCDSEIAQHLPDEADAAVALEKGLVDKASTSQLAVLTDEEYERGIGAIRDGIEAARKRGEELRLSVDLRLWATMGEVA